MKLKFEKLFNEINEYRDKVDEYNNSEERIFEETERLLKKYRFWQKIILTGTLESKIPQGYSRLCWDDSTPPCCSVSGEGDCLLVCIYSWDSYEFEYVQDGSMLIPFVDFKLSDSDYKALLNDRYSKMLKKEYEDSVKFAEKIRDVGNKILSEFMKNE